MHKIWVRNLVLFVGLFVMISCTKSTPSKSPESPVARATFYIDKGEYDIAIKLLEEVIETEDNPKVRLVLASAYAGRSGVRVEKYWDYLIGYDAFAKNPEGNQVQDVIPAQFVPEVLDAESKSLLNSYNKQIKEVLSLQVRAEKIPLIPDNQRAGISRARVLLEKLNNPGARLYRSLLTAVAVKAEFMDGDKLVREWSEAQFDLCAPLATKIANWADKVLNLISDGLNDIGMAFPDQNEDYQSKRKEIATLLKATKNLESYQNNVDSVCTVKQ